MEGSPEAGQAIEGGEAGAAQIAGAQGGAGSACALFVAAAIGPRDSETVAAGEGIGGAGERISKMVRGASDEAFGFWPVARGKPRFQLPAVPQHYYPRASHSAR